MSDVGVHDLCVTGKCKSIHILDVNVTNVTCVGTTMALKNLPALKELRHDSIVETLAYLHQTITRGELPADTKYSLSALTIRVTSPYEKGNLSEAVFLCPSLTKVDITAPDGFKNRDLLHLLQAEKLSDLTISGTRTGQISFDGGVASLFRKSSIGNSLKSLVLCQLPKVNIRIITEYCPNLRSLILDKNDRYEEFCNEDPAPKTLKKLETLKVVSCNSYANLLLLLSSPSLVSATLDHCYALYDDILQNVVELDLFRNLEHLEIISNFRITKKGIDFLMRESNPLKVLKLKDITCLTEMNMDDWKKQIRDERWQLSITKQGRF